MDGQVKLSTTIEQNATEAMSMIIEQQQQKINFILCQVVALVIGLVFRAYSRPCNENVTSRHLICTFLGILIGYLCYGSQLVHLLLQTFAVYLTFLLCPRNRVHIVSLIVAMGYLSFIHIYFMFYDYGNNFININLPMMVSTQKLTSMAFAYYDGMRDDNQLNVDQKQQSIKTRPSFLEFTSYMLNFQGVVVGPLCFYRDYIEFINGESVCKHDKKGTGQLPSVGRVLTNKLASVSILAFIYFNVTIKFPISANLNEEVLNRPFWYRVFYLCLSSHLLKCKFYLTWTLADVTNNASGLGFNGYDETTGRPRWDLITNIRVLRLETSTSLKAMIDNWNIQTNVWLRRLVYDRVYKGRTLCVFVLSAAWHGFYPGYYVAFLLFALLTYAGRGIRRVVRPYFEATKILKSVYDVITWAASMLVCAYAFASYDFLEFESSIRFYK